MFRQPFVEGWDFVAVLGEGTFGQVKLAMNTKNNNHLVAVKIIEVKRIDDYKNVDKEICIHKSLAHDRIVKFLGFRREPEECYIFMEYVSGGELYSIIEPNTPLDRAVCHRLFSQLLDGVEFIHSKGIVHRDLKLENLLLDENENLKIADFGLSTMFRFQGKERTLERVCGSPPYAAPEVLAGHKHRAQPADIWSCGIILYIMFQGEMPWDVANLSSVEYSRWANRTYPSNKWGKLSKYQIDVLRKILDISPEKRATIVDIRLTRWFRLFIKHESKSRTFSPSSHNTFSNHFSLSQPPVNLKILKFMETSAMAPNARETDDAYFSQPIQTDDILATQASLTPTTDLSQQNLLARISKRLTRIIVGNTEFEALVSFITQSLDSLNCSWKLITQKCISVLVTDIRNQPLNFKVHIFCPPNGKILVDFRLYKGDGLEFKRYFKLIKESLAKHIPSII